MPEIAVTLAALKNHAHIAGDIERGESIYHNGGIEISQRGPNLYSARVPQGNDTPTVTIAFSQDGRDIEQYTCDCCGRSEDNPLCRHIVAAVLAIQGGAVESAIMPGKSAAVSAVVSASNTAKAVGSGSLDVLATPMMIALMERAACACLSPGTQPGETSVGTQINVSHTAASPLGAAVTASATITSVSGRRIEFEVTASDESGLIGKGTHTRVIIEADNLLAKAKARIRSIK